MRRMSCTGALAIPKWLGLAVLCCCSLAGCTLGFTPLTACVTLPTRRHAVSLMQQEQAQTVLTHQECHDNFPQRRPIQRGSSPWLFRWLMLRKMAFQVAVVRVHTAMFLLWQHWAWTVAQARYSIAMLVRQTRHEFWARHEWATAAAHGVPLALSSLSLSTTGVTRNQWLSLQEEMIQHNMVDAQQRRREPLLRMTLLALVVGMATGLGFVMVL